MSIEIELALFVVFGLVCAITYLIWGISTVNEFKHKSEQIEKWAKEELNKRDGE